MRQESTLFITTMLIHTHSRPQKQPGAYDISRKRLLIAQLALLHLHEISRQRRVSTLIKDERKAKSLNSSQQQHSTVTMSPLTFFTLCAFVAVCVVSTSARSHTFNDRDEGAALGQYYTHRNADPRRFKRERLLSFTQTFTRHHTLQATPGAPLMPTANCRAGISAADTVTSENA